MTKGKLSMGWKNVISLIGLFGIVVLLSSCRTDQELFTAIINVNILPMTEEIILENQTVLI